MRFETNLTTNILRYDLTIARNGTHDRTLKETFENIPLHVFPASDELRVSRELKTQNKVFQCFYFGESWVPDSKKDRILYEGTEYRIDGVKDYAMVKRKNLNKYYEFIFEVQ